MHRRYQLFDHQARAVTAGAHHDCRLSLDVPRFPAALDENDVDDRVNSQRAGSDLDEKPTGADVANVSSDKSSPWRIQEYLDADGLASAPTVFDSHGELTFILLIAGGYRVNVTTA